MNIYELTGQYQKLQLLIESGDFTEEELQDTFESLDFDIEEKAENYGLVIKNLESQANGLDAEIKRLSERKGMINKNITRMKDNLLGAMKDTGKLKFNTTHFAFSTRKSTSVSILVEIEELAAEYIKEKTTKSADKTLIGKALKAGQEVFGAELVEKINFSMK